MPLVGLAHPGEKARIAVAAFEALRCLWLEYMALDRYAFPHVAAFEALRCLWLFAVEIARVSADRPSQRSRPCDAFGWTGPQLDKVWRLGMSQRSRPCDAFGWPTAHAAIAIVPAVAAFEALRCLWLHRRHCLGYAADQSQRSRPCDAFGCGL